MSALKGIRVLELAESVSGEYCGKLLAEFGAEVIKIERPETGSPTRQMGPFADDQPGTERSGLFVWLNNNKHSVALDVQGEQGKAAVSALLKNADVVIDDHDTDWLSALGLEESSLADQFPGLLLCQISNFGDGGGTSTASDLNLIHSSGWGYHTPTGADPARAPLKGAGRFMASYESGQDAALCICAALFNKLDGGPGRWIEIDRQAVLVSRNDYVVNQMVNGEMPVSEDRHAFDLGGPAGIFPCTDGYVYIWLSAPSHWQGLAELMDDTDWMSDFPDNWLERDCTPERVAVCREYLGKWLASQSRIEVVERAQKLGVTMVAVNNAEDLRQCPQYQHREYFQTLKHEELGELQFPTAPYRMSRTPVSLHSAAPALGQHDAAWASEGAAS